MSQPQRWLANSDVVQPPIWPIISRPERKPSAPPVITPELQIETLRTAVKALMAGHPWAQEAAAHALELSA